MAIPADTQKPADQRLKTGAFRKTERAPKLPLPIGVSNYCLASSEYYYIDKTMMIKDFIDERPMVTLFTRPRRFGKTWICCALILKRATRIPPSISGTRRSGPAARSTGIIRASTL